jgi:hypothetical protein
MLPATLSFLWPARGAEMWAVTPGDDGMLHPADPIHWAWSTRDRRRHETA